MSPDRKPGSTLILVSNVLLVLGAALIVLAFLTGPRGGLLVAGVVSAVVSGGLAAIHARGRGRRMRT